MPTASTRLFALLGDPVGHSLSPLFQNAALRAAGLDGVYVALRCAAGDVPGLLIGIARAGGGGNVTLPHKEAAARAVERRTEAVEATGACNTFWAEGGTVWGDNTDAEGVSAAVRALLGRSAEGARVLLVGAGGSARAALHALIGDGAERIVVLNRTRARAEEMVARAQRKGTDVSVEDDARRLTGERFDLAVNATPLGLKAGDAFPLGMPVGAGRAGGGEGDREREEDTEGEAERETEAEREAGAQRQRYDAALDLVYAPGGTAWVRALQSRGVPAADGTEMLLRQGAASFQRWWGRPAPLEAMRAALAAGGAR